MATPQPARPTAEGVRDEVPPAGASLALSVLVALVVLSPWPFGSVHLRATQAIVLVALATALIVLGLQWRGQPRSTWLSALDSRATKAAAFALGLWLVGAAQLVPLPRALHQLLAPGSAAIWHPSVPVAAAVLGAGPHPISVYPAATARWLAFFAAVVVLALLAAPALRERRVQLRVSIAIVSSAVVLALYAFLARLWFGDRLFGVYESLIKPFGPFVSKNHFAGYVEMAALLAVGLASGLASENRAGSGPLGWIESRRATRVVLAWAAAAVLVLAVPVSLSRGGVVSLGAGLLAFVLLRVACHRYRRDHGNGDSARRRVALGLVAGLGALAVVAAALTFVLPDSARSRVATIGAAGGDSSSSYRLGLWRDTLRLVASSPVVGSGFGAFEDAIPRFKTAAGDVRVEHAESDVLELLSEGGLVGAGLAAAALVFVFASAWRHLRDDLHRLSRGLRTGALAALAALLAHSFFDFNLHIPSNALLAALVTAVAFAPATNAWVTRPVLAGESEPSSPTAEVMAAPTQRPALPLAIALAILASLALAVASPWAESRPDDKALSSRSGSLRRTTTDRELVAHLRRCPADAQTWLLLAWLRSPETRGDGAALAQVATRLDPTHERLASAAARIRSR
jgi:O-antigen ligase